MKKTNPIQWKDEKGEKVKPVLWVWEAHYKDGKKLKQYDEKGVFHRFKEIDQPKLAVFRMRRFDNEKKHYDLIFSKGMKLVHFYRNYFLRNGKYFLRTFCFGYERKINGKNIKMIITILPDDTIIAADQDISLSLLLWQI